MTTQIDTEDIAQRVVSKQATSSNTQIYAGLSPKTRVWILVLAAFIAICNLAFAWHFVAQTGANLSLSEADMKPFASWIATAGGDKLSVEARYDLSARAMNIVTSLKLVSNKQALVLTCFGGAFALIAIGFALFIIGADGAFKIIASAPATSRLAITGTAPGLLCFVISGWLIVKGIEHRSEFHPPDLRNTPIVFVNGTATIQADKTACESIGLIDGNCK